MADYLNRIVTEFDNASWNTYVSEFIAGVDRMEAAASKGVAGGGAGAGATGGSAAAASGDVNRMVSELNQARVALETNIAAFGAAGVELEQKTVNAMRGFLNAQAASIRGFANYGDPSALLLNTNQAKAAARTAVATPEAPALSPAQEAIAVNKDAVASSAKLREDPAYLESVTKLTTENNEMAAALAADRAGSEPYLQSVVHATTAKNEEAAAVASELAGDRGYLDSTVSVATARQEQVAAETAALAANRQYLASTAAVASERNLLAAAEADVLAGNVDYLRSVRLAAIGKNVQAAAEAEALAGDRAYLDSTVASATSKKLQAATEAEALAANKGYIAVTVREATQRNVTAAAEAEALAADKDYIAATGAAARAKQEQAFAETGGRLNNPRYVDSAGAAAAAAQIERATLAASQAQALQATPGGVSELGAMQGQAAASAKELAAATDAARNKILAGSDTYAANTAAAAESMRLIKAQITAETLTLAEANPAIAQLELTNTLRQRVLSEQERLAVARATLADDNEITLIAQRKVADQELNDAIKERVAQERKAQGLAPSPSSSSGSGGALAALGLGGGAFAGIAAITLGFDFVNQFKLGIQAAEALNQQLQLIGNQMNSLGQGTQFPAFTAAIKSVSEQTGVSQTAVATLGQEFLGLYGHAGEAAAAMADAAKIILTTGQSAQTAGPQIASLAEDFGVSVNSIGNAIIDLQNKTGRTGADLTAALAGVAPVVADLGGSFDDARRLIDAFAAGSAKSGQQIGEALARTLPQVQGNLAKLMTAGFHFDPLALSGNVIEVYKQVLTQVAADPGLKDVATTILGGTRNAPVIAAAFANPNRSLAALGSPTPDSNLLTERAAAAQDTLKNAINRVTQAIQGMSESFIRGGIGTFLKDLASDAALVVGALTDVSRMVGDVLGLFGGFGARLLEVAAAFAVLSRVIQSEFIQTALQGVLTQLPKVVLALAALGEAGTINGLISGVAVMGRMTAAVVGLDVAKTADTGISTREAVALALETLAVDENRFATEGDTVAESMNALARMRNATAATEEAAASGLAAAGQSTSAITGAGAGIIGAGGSALEGLGGPIGIAIGITTAAVALTVGAAIKKSTNTKVNDLLKQYDVLSGVALTKAMHDNAKIDPQGDIVRSGTKIAVKALEIPATAGLSLVPTLLNPVFDQLGIHIPDPGTAISSGISNLLFGGSAGRKSGVASQVDRGRLVQAQSAQIQALLNNGNLSIDDVAAIQKDLSDPTNAKKFKDLEERFKAAAATPAGADALHALAAADAAAKAISVIAANAGTSFSTITDAQAAFQNGTISYSVYMKSLQTKIDSLAYSSNPTDITERNKYLVDKLKTRAAAYMLGADTQLQLAKDMGGVTSDQTQLADLSTIITDPNSGLSPADKDKYVKQYVALLASTRDKGIAAANSLSGLNAALSQPLTIPQALVDVEIANLQQQGAPLPKEYQAVLDAETANKMAAVARAHLEEILRREGEGFAQAEKDAYAAFPDVAVPAVTINTTAPDAVTRAQRALALADAQGKLQVATDTLNHKGQAAANDAYAAAKTHYDNVVAADKAAAAAAGKPYDAGTDTAALDAAAAVQTAYGNVQSVLEANIMSKSKLLQAIATAGGDPVAAAKLAVSDLQQQISYAEAHGAAANSTEVQNLQASLVTAQANVGSTQIATAEKRIQTQLALNRITRAQAIAQLEQLRVLATTQDARDALDLQIKQMSTGAQGNLQFDLPTLFNMPTLYEARRLNQTPQGVGYADNRIINLTLNAFNAVDVAQAQAILTNAVGGGATFGVYAKRMG